MISDYKPYISRLRSCGLRPTRQRLMICEALFKTKKTFHFTIENLKKIIDKRDKNKISLATLYNTIYAFKKNGFIKEIPFKANKTFFDTNTNDHHHFFDEKTKKIIDINDYNISVCKIPKIPFGKKISGIEVMIKIVNSNHNQKKNL